MRMRGQDVIAKPALIEGTDLVVRHWKRIFKNAEVLTEFKGSGKDEIIKMMKTWDNGARAEVYVQWSNDALKNPAHVFIAENRNGQIAFLDPQTGELDVEYYFGMVRHGLTQLIRLDNLEPRERLIKMCCEVVKSDNS